MKAGIGDGPKETDAERARLFPGQVCAHGLALQHGQVETHRMADEHTAGAEDGEGGERLRECGSAADVLVANAMDLARCGGYRLAGVDQRLESFVGLHAAQFDADAGELYDARPRRVEAGRLGVDCDCLKSGKRHRSAYGLHRIPPSHALWHRAMRSSPGRKFKAHIRSPAGEGEPAGLSPSFPTGGNGAGNYRLATGETRGVIRRMATRRFSRAGSSVSTFR